MWVEVLHELDRHIAQQHTNVKPSSEALVLLTGIFSVVTEFRPFPIARFLLKAALNLETFDVLLSDSAITVVDTLFTVTLRRDRAKVSPGGME
jgi:hypothetical protein